MGLTIGQLAAAIRLTSGDPPPEPQLSILTRLLGAAEATIEAFAPLAPESVREEATVRMASFLYDQPATGRRGSYQNASATPAHCRYCPDGPTGGPG